MKLKECQIYWCIYNYIIICVTLAFLAIKCVTFTQSNHFDMSEHQTSLEAKHMLYRSYPFLRSRAGWNRQDQRTWGPKQPFSTSTKIDSKLWQVSFIFVNFRKLRKYEKIYPTCCRFFCWLKTTSTRLKTKTKSHSTAAAESEYAKTWMTVSVDFHWQISAPSTKLYQVTHVPCLNAPKNHVANRKKYSFCAEPATITGQRNPMDLGNCFSFKPRWIRVGSQLVKLHSICKMVWLK